MGCNDELRAFAWQRRRAHHHRKARIARAAHLGIADVTIPNGNVYDEVEVRRVAIPFPAANRSGCRDSSLLSSLLGGRSAGGKERA
jgi:hypothetical protein